MKKMFEPFINMLSDEKLKEFTYSALEKIPSYFWEIPASSSGKYHPYHDLGIGGTVRHTVMVMQCALDLLRMENENPDPLYIDAVIISCMFHDSFKNGLEDTGHTIQEHPALASDFVINHFCYYDISFAMEVGRAILSHMGRWNTDKEGKKILPTPSTKLAELVHMADYIASRKYILYMPI